MTGDGILVIFVLLEYTIQSTLQLNRISHHST